MPSGHCHSGKVIRKLVWNAAPVSVCDVLEVLHMSWLVCVCVCLLSIAQERPAAKMYWSDDWYIAIGST